MRDIGWASSDGTPLSDVLAGLEARDNTGVLRRLGGLHRDWRSHEPERPTPDGVLFARAALQTWPARP
jgi:hypothetical protein